MILAPTELGIAETTMIAPAMTKIVKWLAGSRCVANQMFESDVT